MHGSFWISVFLQLNTRNCWIDGNSVLNFLRNLHSGFYREIFIVVCTNLYPHHQYTNVPVSPHPHWNLLFLVIAFLMIAISWFCAFTSKMWRKVAASLVYTILDYKRFNWKVLILEIGENLYLYFVAIICCSPPNVSSWLCHYAAYHRVMYINNILKWWFE